MFIYIFFFEFASKQNKKEINETKIDQKANIQESYRRERKYK